MKKSRGIISLSLTVVLIAAMVFTLLVGLDKNGTGAARHIKQGLDLAGGVSITYQAVEENPSSEDMADTVYKLQKRVETYSTEASVYQEGSNRINIEIPGVSNATEILEELGKPGSLAFYDENDQQVLAGTDVKSAKAVTGQDQTTGATEYQVELVLTSTGSTKFAEATAANVNKQISIVYDEEVISAPVVNEAITGGTAYISGMESYEEAEELASFIRIGGLSLELEELHSKIVGAQLGSDAIRTSLLAAIIGLIIIFILMCVVYRLPGFASSVALIIYTALVLMTVNAFDITLTLPGIAGIILGIGMAVDANVIIFVRVKEEIAEGKSVYTALKAGFQKAFSAIFDGNITTLIAAVVLLAFGSGTVKGFAYTLAIGIIWSMVTALLVTRWIIFALYAVGFQDVKFYGAQKERKVGNFIGRKKISFAIVGVMLVVGIATMSINAARGKGAFQYGLEFKGGTAATVTFDKDYTIEEIDATIVPKVEELMNDANVQTQKVADSNAIIIKTQTMDEDTRAEFEKLMQDEFGVTETVEFENVSGVISTEMTKDAIVALVIAAVCMLLYIWIRFKDIRFGTSAVLALLHDVFLVITFYAISRISLGNTFIACILTIVGYSINSTIVIFDRIREKLAEQRKKESIDDVVNGAISDTMTRSIYTNLTTLVMIVMLYILGVSSIKEFALPLIVGVIGGTFSSICVTGPLWRMMRKLGKNGK